MRPVHPGVRRAPCVNPCRDGSGARERGGTAAGDRVVEQRPDDAHGAGDRGPRAVRGLLRHPDAERAQQAGLVSDIHPANLSDEYALKLAATIARHSPLALRAVTLNSDGSVGGSITSE